MRIKITSKQRKILCLAVNFAAAAVLAFSGAGWWAMLLTPYGMLEYWDGMTDAEEIWCK